MQTGLLRLGAGDGALELGVAVGEGLPGGELVGGGLPGAELDDADGAGVGAPVPVELGDGFGIGRGLTLGELTTTVVGPGPVLRDGEPGAECPRPCERCGEVVVPFAPWDC
jgi:hypothetical protein